MGADDGTGTESMTETAMVTVGARILRKMRDDLDQVATVTRRNRSALVEEALRRFIDTESAQLADIEAGLREADADDFATDEEMRALWSRCEGERQR